MVAPLKKNAPGWPCDCDCEGGCILYTPCCINAVHAEWSIYNPPTFIIEGVTFRAFLTNLCNGSVGLDWSSYFADGRKQAATVGAGLRSLISTSTYFSMGCLMGMNVDHNHLVCPCVSSSYNFKLTVEVLNCDETEKTWYTQPGSGTLGFSTGLPVQDSPEPDHKNCNLITAAYQIDGGPIIPVTDMNQDDEVPIVVPGEEIVEVCWYFLYNPACAHCADPADLSVPPPAVISQGTTTLFNESTPKKDCRIQTCNNASVPPGGALTVENEYDDCNDCNPAPTAPVRTPTYHDTRTYACWNCFWQLVSNRGWESETGDPKDIYGDDPDCACGCPNCAERRTAKDCIPPNILGSVTNGGTAKSGSTSICLIGGIFPSKFWHGVNGDGCVPSINDMDDQAYLGPSGVVSMNFGGDTGGLASAQEEIDYNAWLSGTHFGGHPDVVACAVIDIAWNTTDPDGGGNVTMTMTIGGWTASRTFIPLATNPNEPIHYVTDHACS